MKFISGLRSFMWITYDFLSCLNVLVASLTTSVRCHSGGIYYGKF